MLHHLFLYLLAVIAVALFPGPDMLFIMSQSVNHGKRLGLAATAGIGSGCFVHIFAVSIGLSSLLVKSAIAFTIVKYLGACYLLYIGISSLIQKHSLTLDSIDNSTFVSWKKVFWRGFITNVLNPKVALFFLAFLPQFIVPESQYSLSIQFLILGLIFNFVGSSINALAACFFGIARKWLSSNPTALKIQQKLTGMIFIGLGLRLAAFEKG